MPQGLCNVCSSILNTLFPDNGVTHYTNLQFFCLNDTFSLRPNIMPILLKICNVFSSSPSHSQSSLLCFIFSHSIYYLLTYKFLYFLFAKCNIHKERNGEESSLMYLKHLEHWLAPGSCSTYIWQKNWMKN